MDLQNALYRWLSLCISPLYSVTSVFTVNSWMESPWWLELSICMSPKLCSHFHQDWAIYVHSVQFTSVTQLCLTLCSMPGLPIHHQIQGSTQTHVHWVSDAIQPSHPLSSPSPAFNLSQLQGLFQWIGSSHHVPEVGASASASVIQMNDQAWFPLGLTDLLSLLSKELSIVFSNNTVQKHQFFSAQSSLWYNSHIHTWLLEKR